MRYVKVAAAALNQTPLAWQHNRDNFIAVLKEAQKQKVQVLCCPELAITGYGCEDTFLSINTFQIALEILEELIPHTQNLFVGFGLPLFYKNVIYNTVAVVANGELLGFVAKQNLAGYGIHYEPRWFKPWINGEIATFSFAGRDYPLGDLIFNYNNMKIGFEICEDAWVAARSGIHLAARGVDLILNPSASHFALNKQPLRKRSVLEGASIFGVGYLYSNLLGNEAGRIIYDGDTLIANASGFVKIGQRFSFQDYKLTAAEIDLQMLRSQNKLEGQDTIEGQDTTEISEFSILSGWEKGSYVKEEEFSRATALGLFDYLRKSKTQGFVLNLSGGADSACCACLVYLMVKFGLQELGETEFRRKLSHIMLPDDPNQFMQALLFCLYQRTENNSEETEQAARKIAHTLGASFASFAVDNIIKNYCDLISPLIQRPFSWQTDDVALQNIQARVRAPAAWLLANVRGALLLSPSNRSEASVGYATMDGDTCGGLCPIAGVDKSFILHWLCWLEQTGPEGVGPIPELKYVTRQTPSAELQPKIKAQTDEGDLMPYAWLDLIERLFVLEKLPPVEILQMMSKRYPNEDPTNLAKAIELFLILWTRNQWKRERLAPSFHLNTESIDPKTWCRYPILSGNYAIEIEKMRQYLGPVLKV